MELRTGEISISSGWTIPVDQIAAKWYDLEQKLTLSSTDLRWMRDLLREMSRGFSNH
jgi:hypothetical protein